MKSLLIRLIKKLGDMRRHLLYYRIWPAVYRHAAKKPIDEKKVLLASNSKTLPDNLSCMKRELEARGMHCTEMLIPAGAGSISARAAEFRQNIRFQREYATSKLVFVEDAFFPLFANHPRNARNPSAPEVYDKVAEADIFDFHYLLGNQVGQPACTDVAHHLGNIEKHRFKRRSP